MQIIELEAGDEGCWNEYVNQAPDTSFFHLAGWREVLAKTYSHETRYLMAQDGGEIWGILPLFILRHWLFGTQVSSLPGGLSARNSQTAAALLEAAVAITNEAKADNLLLNAGSRLWDGNLVTSQLYCTQRLALPADPDHLWQGFPTRLRTKIRRAQKEGMALVVGGAECIDAFYEVFSRNLRALGTPVFSKTLVQNIVAQFPEQAKILNLNHEGQVVATMFVFLHKGVVYDQWAASLREYFRCRVNELLYWESLAWASRQGCREFDFGRSRWNSGPYQFKAKWGAQPRPLYYQYYLRRGVRIPDFGLTAERLPTHRLFVSFWQHVPLSLTRTIGPRIRKHLYPL
ncbi:MAG: FemAB family XrtA/PEP-CTERM system-associated protein [Chloroflexota bacterium]